MVLYEGVVHHGTRSLQFAPPPLITLKMRATTAVLLIVELVQYVFLQNLSEDTYVDLSPVNVTELSWQSRCDALSWVFAIGTILIVFEVDSQLSRSLSMSMISPPAQSSCNSAYTSSTSVHGGFSSRTPSSLCSISHVPARY